MTPPVEVPVLTFLGGAGTVTGSRFLLEAGGSRVLVDCGLFQGLKDLRLRNWDPFPVDASTIDAVVVSHAHIDHCGYVPRLVAAGFDGPVFASANTVELAAIVLPDSGHLQEEEAAYANERGYSKHRPALPLYTEEEARRSLDQLVAVDFGEPVDLAPGVGATLDPAGHILGSAIVRVDVESRDAARARRVVFSGDLGRPHHPLLVPPSPLGPADVVVVESTYGDRDHDDAGALEALADAIDRTVRRGGVVLVPAFAVDRTEVLLVHLNRLRERGAIPDVPIYVDSPMALAALAVYRKAITSGSAEIAAEVAADDPFGAESVEEVRDVEGSMALDRLTMPAIVISASGMATGGRVLHHLRRYLPDHRATVVLVGFQAQQTRGRQLADGARQVKLLGRYVPVRADVLDLPSFSVHADRRELLGWLRTADSPPDVVHVVHGEPASSAALQSAINDELGWAASVPKQGERVRLD